MNASSFKRSSVNISILDYRLLFLFSAENKESLNCLEGPKQETGPRCPLVLIQFGLTISWQLWAMWLSSSMFRDKEKDTRHQFIRGSTPLPVKGLGSMTKGGPPSHLRLSHSLTTLAMATFAFSSSLDAISINCSVLSTRERACSAKFPVSSMVFRIFCKRLIWLNKVLFTLWRRSIKFWSTSAIAVQKKVHKLSEGGNISSHMKPEALLLITLPNTASFWQVSRSQQRSWSVLTVPSSTATVTFNHGLRLCLTGDEHTISPTWQQAPPFLLHMASQSYTMTGKEKTLKTYLMKRRFWHSSTCKTE